ncbi:23S rRNA (uracil(1939)-C(5))-methyltransferase RlmD, partial [[Clostridium] innocuum]|nr:23S rRNA (uracil(1939)-C(5))-methyltransferase RlmD [[Clostridium] innocuum]
MLKNNQVVTGIIQGMDEAHNGILRCGKDIVLVRHVMKQEEVRVKIVKRIAKGYIGEVLEIKKASSDRVPVQCPIYARCGSCQLLHMSTQGQQKFKNRSMQELCRKAKGLRLQTEDIVSMEKPWHYRNKMIISFQRDKQRRIQAGFYEEFSHRIIPYKQCLLHPKACDDVVATIVELMGRLRIEPYEEDTRRGLLRHVVLRYGAVSKQLMVVLVLNSPVFPARKNFIQELRKRHPEITTIVQNVNTRKTSVVLGDEERVLYGPGYIEDVLCGMTFRISAKSFYQINHEQTEVLYRRAVELLKLSGRETVLDAYCGIGTIGMYVSQFVKQVVGVEINRDAVEDARINAKINGISNIRFVCEDAGRYMTRLAAEKKRLDVVIMDPPRSGSSEEFIKSLVRMKPRQVLYISCNPQTQVRDLQMLERMGYRVDGNMVPVDLFPHTFHVETVVLLSHKKADSYIHIDVEFGEGEGKIPVDSIAKRAEAY